MDQFALGALAGNNVVLVILAPLERRLAIIEPEMAFRAFGSMAAEARILKNYPTFDQFLAQASDKWLHDFLAWAETCCSMQMGLFLDY